MGQGVPDLCPGGSRVQPGNVPCVRDGYRALGATGPLTVAAVAELLDALAPSVKEEAESMWGILGDDGRVKEAEVSLGKGACV